MSQINQVAEVTRTTNDSVQESVAEHVWGTNHAVFSAMMTNEGLDEETIQRLVIENNSNLLSGIIKHQGVIVGAFKWFEGLDVPCFRWQVEKFRKYSFHKKIVVDGVERIKFRPSLSPHDTVGLIVDGELATPELHQFLMGMLTNWMDDPRYALHREAQAFFQGGSNDPDGGWFYMEFWNPVGVKPFIDYVNEHYGTDEHPYFKLD